VKRAPWLPTLVAFIAFTAVLFAYMLRLQSLGFISTYDLDLWGRAMLANGGLISTGTMVTSYPPLRYVAAMGLDAMFPTIGRTNVALLSALLGGGLATSWFAAFRVRKFGVARAALVTLLLVANPLFLRTVAEGGGFVVLQVGVWVLALGMLNLRRAHRVNDTILVAIALCIIAFSHPFGLAVTFAALPFLALVIPSEQLDKSPLSVFLMLLFPVLFSIAGFLYVNWVFTNDPFNFIATTSRDSASIGFPGGGFATNGAIGTVLAAGGILAACPVGVMMWVRTRKQVPLHLALLALGGTLLAATVLASGFGIAPDLSLTVGLAVAVAAACVAMWPRGAERSRTILLALIGGVIGGGIVVAIDRSGETARWRDAMLGHAVGPPNSELARLGRTLRGENDILFDAISAPIVVAERGSVAGITSASSESFQMKVLLRDFDDNVLVVRSSRSSVGSDRLGRALPTLFDDGMPGYRLLFDGTTWRAYKAVGVPK
jgi:membrane protein XagC